MNVMSPAEGLEALERALEPIDRVLIVTHMNPDGDAVGSALGIRGILEAIGKSTEIVISDSIARKYHFLIDRPVLKFDDPILSNLSEKELFQMVIFVDTSERERVGPVLYHLHDWLVQGAPEVNIDHHVSNDCFGDIVIVDPERASSAELVLRMSETLGVDCTSVIADQLFAAVLTDTGRFQFSNTDAHSLRAAASLVAAGADPSLIARRIYFERPAPFFRLLGHLLSMIDLYHGGRTCLMIMPRELATTFFPDGHLDSEGIVDYTMQVEGVEVGIFIRQTGDGVYRASLRSRGKVDVRLIAEVFGGGGHEKAAGCEVRGSLEKVKDNIVSEVVKWLS